MILTSALTIALLFASTTVFAQGNLAIGAKVGYAQSDLYGEDIEDIEFRESVAAGAFLKFSPVEFIALQPELLFKKKGAVNERAFANTREEYRIDYFEVPVLFKLRIPIGGTVYPNIYAGPYYAFVTDASYKITQQDTDIAVERDVDVKNTDYGGVFGGGVDVEFDFLMLSLDARYGIGGNEIEDTEQPLEIKNQDWTIMGGVGILLGK